MSEELTGLTMNQSPQTPPTQAPPETGKSSEETVSLPTELDLKFKNTRQMSKPRHTRPSMAAANKAENDLTGRSKKGVDLTKVAKPIGELPESSPKEETPTDPTVPRETKSEDQEKTIQEPPKEMTKEEKKRYKVKVNGEDAEVDEDELVRGYQIRKASDKAFQEAAAMRKQAETFFSKIKDKQGLGEVLQAVGVDPRKLAEDYLAEALEFELLSPEQKRIKELEFQNQRFTQTERERQIKAEQSKNEMATQVEAEKLQKNILETLPKYEDIPHDSETIRRVISHMRKAILGQQHIPDELRRPVTPDSVMDDVRAEIHAGYQKIAAKMTPQQMVKYLGKEKLDEFRKWELSQLKNPVSAPKDTITPSTPNRTQPGKHFKTMEDFVAGSKFALRRR